MATKKEVIRERLEDYLKAQKKGKSRILDQVSAVLAMNRKAVIRAFGREQMRHQRGIREHRGRPVTYHRGVTAALKELWKIAGEICAERLHPVCTEYIRILKRDQMWTWGTDTTALLLRMSLGTMKDRTERFVRIKAAGGRSTTKPSDLKELIPIRIGPWENPAPGYGEIDTVVHCGPTLLGTMAYTVNFTDIVTGWTESAAQIDKGQERTRQSIERIAARLPFPLRGLDPDSGSEFVNWHLKEWCDTRGIELSRSRPNHRNDNAHIEQKNYAGVRKFLGYSRIDRTPAMAAQNELYAGPLRQYINFFQPSMRCIEKLRVGSRYRRRYDTPKTPYQRVLEHPGINPSIKDALTRIYATLNPRVLREEIDRLITKIFKMQRLR